MAEATLTDIIEEEGGRCPGVVKEHHDFQQECFLFHFLESLEV